ncbi:type III secretion protein [Sutterella massiliensis]|uniref:Type III secretion protein n=1 Tax=Sutterella massiliensis TaxID=1816689 RepID=A0ABS2DSK9_9BURK|nr:EscF/YscF/HrpA family type III secretion system needle major subunit [Sutterella massiliensis]MBM6704302.1 type III secretion protein [Sutterella massiliensis]
MSDLNINQMFQSLVGSIETYGADLQKQMNAIGGDGENAQLSDTDLLKMQFQVNQYNTLLEMTSTVSKALVDEAKQIAQRAN